MNRGRLTGRHAVTSSGVRAVLWDTHSVTVRAKDQDRALFPDTEVRRGAVGGSR